MVREVILPKLGQTMEEGTLIEWFKQEGESVRLGEVLFAVESDKATLEVESSARGFLRRILVPAGQSVPVLTVVALMTSTVDEDISAYGVPSLTDQEEKESASIEQVVLTLSESKREPAKSAGGRIFAAPRARRLARKKGVDLAQITGSGPGGRIVERDVIAYLETLPKTTPVAQRMAAEAGLDLRTVSGSGPGGRIVKDDVARVTATAPASVVPLPRDASPSPTLAEAVAHVPVSGVRAVIARRMYESHQTTAPVTLTTKVDAAAFVRLRERLKESLMSELGFNLGYNDLLIKVVAHALREFPYMNARLEGGPLTEPCEGVIRHLPGVNVALAVDTERGLLVPVVRHADRKGVVEIAREVRELVERARVGKALPDELSGSTFTVTNLGMYGIDAFTPIISLPEAAILGVGCIKATPAVVGGELCVRQTMWLSLTFDHRLVDGAPAARFLQRIKQLIEEPYLLLG